MRRWDGVRIKVQTKVRVWGPAREVDIVGRNLIVCACARVRCIRGFGSGKREALPRVPKYHSSNLKLQRHYMNSRPLRSEIYPSH